MDPTGSRRSCTTKKFTGKGDVPVVEKLYRDYFEGVASTATNLNFSGLKWGHVEAATLGSVLPRYVSLVSLDMSQNHLGSDGAQRLSEALKTNSSLLELKYAASHRPYSARFRTSVSTP